MKQVTILTIDDESIVRSSFRNFLEDYDYRVIEAENGRVGINTVLKEQPDLVLVDLRMPEMDGLDVLREIQKISTEIPVIVVSGTGVISDAIEAVRLGAWDYLLKPIRDMSVLLYAIEKALERSRLICENREYQEHLQSLVKGRTFELKEANTQLQVVNKRLRQIVESTAKLSHSMKDEGFIKNLLAEFVTHIQADGGAFYKITEDRLILLESLNDFEVPETIDLPLPPNSLLAQTIFTKKAMLLNDEQHEVGIECIDSSRYSTDSYLAFPISQGDSKINGLILLKGLNRKPFEKLDKEIGFILATFGSEALSLVTSTYELRRSEEKFKSYIDNAPDGIFVSKKGKGFISVNKAAQKMTGYTEAELLGMCTFDLVIGGKNPKVMTFIDQLYEKGYISGENFFRTKDGEIRAWTIDAVTLGKDIHLSFAKDITEKKEVEEALRKSEENHRITLNSIGDAVIATDVEGRITAMNPVAEKMTEAKFEDVEGLKFDDIIKIIDFESRMPINNPVDDILANKFRMDIDSTTVLVTQSGKERHIADSGAPIRNENGETVGAVLILRDITEQYLLENQLKQAQKMEAIGQLAGGVAHDFNNLLTVINGYTEMLRYEFADNPSLVSGLEEIAKAGNQAANLTRQLLAFSRKQVITPRIINLNDIVKGISKMLRRLVTEDIEIDIDLAEELPPIKADQGQIEQIFINLVVNARDAIEASHHQSNRKIIVKTAVKEFSEPTNMLTGKAVGKFVVIKVKDSGSGIPPDLLDKIFEPFFTTKKEGKGTGLGLATIYGIVKQNKGFIDIDSKLNKGTEFSIYWNEAQEIADASDEEELKTVMGNGEKILIVEDDEPVRRLAAEILSIANYSVLEAESGEDALKLVKSLDSPIDMLITDVIMPGIDGKTLSDKISKIQPDIKVLFVSGYTDEYIANKGILEKGVNYLSKPFTPKSLTSKIKGILADEKRKSL